MPLLFLLAPLLLALPAAALLDVEHVPIRNAGNSPDVATNCLPASLGEPDCGSVPYDYAISKYEITNGEYVQFLNEVANEVDAHGLYDANMAIDFPPVPVGFERFYVAKPGFENKPVVYVSFYDALRFANWLHNGQPHGLQDDTTTEDGAYTLTGDLVGIQRNPGATAFLPSENEWYKAAYYDPMRNGGTGGYFDYPTATDTPTTCTTPTAGLSTANCDSLVGGVTDVGSYPSSPSPYGTFDQGGNVFEWNEAIGDLGAAELRSIRGGGWDSDPVDLEASHGFGGFPSSSSDHTGFRVARPVPEPAELLLVLSGGLAMAAAGRRRR